MRTSHLKWVPHRFVPDKYAIGADPPRLRALKRSNLGVSVQERIVGASAEAVDNGMKPPRYNKRCHEQAFLSALKSPPFNGVVPKKRKDIEALIERLPFDPSKTLPWSIEIVRNNCKKLAKNNPDITTSELVVMSGCLR